MIYRVSYMSGGAGFLPSTVVEILADQEAKLVNSGRLSGFKLLTFLLGCPRCQA